MDIVLGVSMAPTNVRMLLVEGENADGVTVEDTNFDIATDDEASTLNAADQVISAILGTREGATEAGHALGSTGVTWTDPVDAAALHAALSTRKIENVMLVSAFMAAAALTQMVGNAVGDAHTALLFLEPDTATLAIVDSADGSITDVHKEVVSGADTIAALARMVDGLDAAETRPQSVFIVGAGVDVGAVKPQLGAVTSLPVTAAEEPETALAWGAALASANAPLFASSTAALAYAQDPGTGAIDPYAVAPGYLAVPDVPLGSELGEDDLAYSALPDEEAAVQTAGLDALSDDDAAAHTLAAFEPADEIFDGGSERRPFVLLGSMLAVVVVAAALSLEVALALGVRPSVALLPRPLQSLIMPLVQAPAPAPVSAPVPQVHSLPAPVKVAAPVHASIPAAPPIPVAVAPPPIAAPVPVVVPLPVPVSPPIHIAPLHLSPPAPVHISPQPPPVQFPSPQPPPVGVPHQPPWHLPIPIPVHVPEPQQPVLGVAPEPPGRMPSPGMPGFGPPSGPGMPSDGPHGPGFGGPPSFTPPGGGFGGNPGSGGFGGNPGSGGFGGNPGFGGFGGNPGGGFGGLPGLGGFGGNPGFGGGFGDGPGDHEPGGFGGGFGGGGFGGGGFGGGGHSGGGGFGGGGGHSGGGGHH